MNTKYWGYHLILDCKACDRYRITDPAKLDSWVKKLVEEIDMVAYGEPQIVHFGNKEPHLTGYTVLQLIETSSITAHFCDESGDAYIDIFSCKPFDKEVAKWVVEGFFRPEAMRETYLVRQA